MFGSSMIRRVVGFRGCGQRPQPPRTAQIIDEPIFYFRSDRQEGFIHAVSCHPRQAQEYLQ